MLGMYIAAGATIPHTYGIFDGTARKVSTAVITAAVTITT